MSGLSNEMIDELDRQKAINHFIEFFLIANIFSYSVPRKVIPIPFELMSGLIKKFGFKLSIDKFFIQIEK